MRELSLAISEAARATSLQELGVLAFPALARALDACPVFFAVTSEDFVRSKAIAGEHRGVFNNYLREFLMDDPLIGVALTVPRPVLLVQHHVDRRTLRASRAYHDFHRVHGFEHHMLVRFHGEHIREPGALSLGFTRNRRLPEFGTRERRMAELVLPALQGAARRIETACSLPAVELETASLVAERGLTRAETRVLHVLLLGLSNRDIAERLSLSIDTVKTHVHRIFRKLGVASRAQTLARVRESGGHVSPGAASVRST
jgi:DNA-binding CsgD family transcriptional regulator